MICLQFDPAADDCLFLPIVHCQKSSLVDSHHRKFGGKWVNIKRKSCCSLVMLHPIFVLLNMLQGQRNIDSPLSSQFGAFLLMPKLSETNEEKKHQIKCCSFTLSVSVKKYLHQQVNTCPVFALVLQQSLCVGGYPKGNQRYVYSTVVPCRVQVVLQ